MIRSQRRAVCPAPSHNTLLPSASPVDEEFAVDDIESLDIFDGIHPFAFKLGCVGLFAECGEHVDMTVARFGVAPLKSESSVSPSRSPLRLILSVYVSSDAFARSTYLRTALGFFVGSVKQAVGRHDQVHFLRYFQD